MVKVGLIGFGYWGPNIARSISELPEVELSYIIDTKKENREKAKSRFPTAIVGENEEILLNDPTIQGVFVATPANTHYYLAKKLLEAGKDIFVEKPLALSLEEGEELVKIAKERGRILMVGHLMLYHPAVMMVKKMIKEGEIGALRYFFSQRLSLGRVRTDENVLWSLAPHDISILLFLCEEMPSFVCAHGGSFLQGNVEDIVLVHLDFPSGVVADIQVSWLAPHKIRKILLVGENKMFLIDDVEAFEKLKVYEHSIDINSVPFLTTFTPRYGNIWAPYLPPVEPLKAECEEFLRCVTNREIPKTDGEEGLRVLRVLAAAQKSLETGQKVAIEKT